MAGRGLVGLGLPRLPGRNGLSNPWVGGAQCTFDVETAVTSLAPFLAMPSFSYFLPTMKPVMF